MVLVCVRCIIILLMILNLVVESDCYAVRTTTTALRISSFSRYRIISSSSSSSSSSNISILTRRMAPCRKMLVGDSAEGDNDEIEFTFEKGFLYKKKKDSGFKKSDNRDSLPFIVTFDDGKSGTRTEIGTYLLDSTTNCGDFLDLGGRLFEVKKVSFLYKYESGGFRVFKKKLDVAAAKASWGSADSGGGIESNEGFLQ